jgi:hypothetical protein
MTSELSIFAARVSDYIAICAAELASEHHQDAQFQVHADAEFNGMALMLFTLQFEHNPAYRKFCEARKVSPSTTTHWTQIPAVPTSAFKDLELSCLPTDKRTQVFHSSGTTAQKPSRHFHSAESLVVYEVSLLPWFRFHVQPNNHLAILTPPPGQAPNSSLVHMFETIRRDFGAPATSFLGALDRDGAWTLNFEPAIAALENASRTGERIVVLGTAFSFVHLLDYLAEKNLRFTLPHGSRVMETGGYKNRSRVLLKKELHALIAERLGVPSPQILCEYGMSELSSQAYDVEPHHSSSVIREFRFPPWARVQIVSPETDRSVRDGEKGLLRIFDLANVFSVMAIQTEDLAIARGERFELVGRAEQSEPRGCSLMTA